ncbi:MAG: hypothetical protein KGH79_05040 [Patescibacteria group bacterium]|nr:hypothetical protein [Patescibacteria group bacterium]
MKYPDITLGRVEAVWNKLGGEEGVQRLLAGYCEVVVKEHVINCDADPFVPNGWKVEEHKKGGQLKWDASQVALYLSKGQQGGKVIEGNKLRKELADKPAYNANVLDYLLANPDLIPEEWKGKCVFFWGTVYRRSVGSLYVRYLYWNGDGWYWSDNWLDSDWDGNDPAAVPAS